MEAKESLLASLATAIKNIGDHEELEGSVLHCDIEGKSGKTDCNLLGKMEQDTKAERHDLDSKDKSMIENYAENVKKYHCACSFSEWSKWSECVGGDVAQLYDHCDVQGNLYIFTPKAT